MEEGSRKGELDSHLILNCTKFNTNSYIQWSYTVRADPNLLIHLRCLQFPKVLKCCTEVRVQGYGEERVKAESSHLATVAMILVPSISFFFLFYPFFFLFFH